MQCRWNCERLFDVWRTELPAGTTVEPLLKTEFDEPFEAEYLSIMRRKVP